MSRKSVRRNNQSGKSKSSHSSKHSYSSSKERSIKATKIEENANFKRIQFLEQPHAAENQAAVVHEEMEGAKGKMEVCKSYNEVNAEEVQSHHQ